MGPSFPNSEASVSQIDLSQRPGQEIVSSPGFFDLPLWYAGFRPFFLLAFISGVAFPLIWGAMFAGWITLPQSAPDALMWHAHEMFYGFGWAVLGGFLLTSSKNWVKIRGIHGKLLALAAGLWVLERGLMLVAGKIPVLPRLLLLNGSILFIGGYIITSLVKYRRKDFYKDNPFFVVLLSVLIVSHSLMLVPQTFSLGTSMTLGLFRMAFVIMFERTMTQFMKNSMKLELLRNPFLDFGIKGLALATVFAGFMPQKVATALLAAFGLLLLTRWILWKPLKGLRNFGIGLMYVGYMGVVVHLALEVLHSTGKFVGFGKLSLHAFTFLVMGLIIPAMFIRICQGHTGRKLVFTVSDRLAIGLMAVGAVLRLVVSQIWLSHYALWIGLSAVAWALCFAIVGWRVGRFVFYPRIDGRIH